MSDLNKALRSIPQRLDVNPTEIQHPTDLIATSPHFELTHFLIRLKVLPDDIWLMTCQYWEDYGS